MAPCIVNTCATPNCRGCCGLQLSAPQPASLQMGASSAAPGVTFMRPIGSGSGGGGMPFAMSMGSSDLQDLQPSCTADAAPGSAKGVTTWSALDLDSSQGFAIGNSQQQGGVSLQVRPLSLPSD